MDELLDALFRVVVKGISVDNNQLFSEAQVEKKIAEPEQ